MALQAITSEGQGREACGHRAQFGAPCLESKDADTLQLGSGLFNSIKRCKGNAQRIPPGEYLRRHYYLDLGTWPTSFTSY